MDDPSANQPPSGPKAFFLTEDLARYVSAHSSPPDPVLERLIERTRQMGSVFSMQISPEQGAFMSLLTAAIGARVAVEVGTFTGYSSVCIARGLGPGGRLIACDLSDEWTSVARAAWLDAGVADRIDLRLGPAAETLAALAPDLVVDLAFIDADKENYLVYYEALLARMRPGGVILADNVLWSGKVVDPEVHDADTLALRAFNDAVVNDPRVEVAMLPLADGLSVIRVLP